GLIDQRQYDAILLVETHAGPEHSDDLLRHWSKNGYKAVCTPALPTDRTALSGGAVLGFKNTFMTSSFRHLALNQAQQVGMRDLSSTKGNIDFFDFVPVVWHIHGVSLCLVSAYLTSSIGLKGVNLQKLAILGGFIKSLDIPWASFADWNVPPSTLMQSGWPAMLGGVPVVPTDVDYTCTIGSGAMLDYGIVSPHARLLISSLTADTSVVVARNSVAGKAHFGLKIDIR
ncbi:unnamed protein product, partial [Prorocentrum cordatum]